MSDQSRQADLHSALLALHDSEERYRLLFASLPGYAGVMVDQQGLIVSWSAEAERIIGYRSDEIIGQNFACLRTPEDIEQGLQHEELRLALERGHYHDENWRRRKDGTRFWADISTTPLRD